MEEAWKLAFAVAMRLLVGQVNRRELAEDITQEAMVRILRHKEPIRRSWKALVRLTVSRLVLNHQRNEATRRGHVCFDSEAVSRARDDWPSPPDMLIEEETETELWVLLDQLDEVFGVGTRAIVDLRAQDVPWSEVIDIVELPLRTCSSREKRAREWISERLSLEVAEGGRHE
jgi:RNA polymerase sigma factor (sigma-70 family)